MSPHASAAAARAARVFDAAADSYDAPGNGFWERIARRAVARLALAPGSEVLDFGCGSGVSLLAAAHAVGPRGRATGLDVSQRMLDLAWRKAIAEGLETRVTLRALDLLEAEYPAASFDAVLSVLSLFFLDDLPHGLRRLWGWVRPGGVLSVTTWAEGAFEPADAIFWDAVREIRPDLYRGFHPWDRLTTIRELVELFEEAGVPAVDCVVDRLRHPLASPEGFWTIALGSGYRGTVDELALEEREALRRSVVARLAERGVDSLPADVIHAVARRPAA